MEPEVVEVHQDGVPMRLLCARPSHLVADTSLGEDVPWMLGIVPQLAAEIPNEDAHEVFISRVFRSPYPVQQLFVSHYSPDVDGQLEE